MAKINLIPPTKSRSKITEEWLDNCALEGIFPSQETRNELAYFNNSKLTPAQFRTYLIEKYRPK